MDDAIGEAYDKTARLLGLDVGGGGGPALARALRRCRLYHPSSVVKFLPLAPAVWRDG